MHLHYFPFFFLFATYVSAAPVERREAQEVVYVTVTRYPSATDVPVSSTNIQRVSTNNQEESQSSPNPTPSGWTQSNGKCQELESDFNTSPEQCGVSWIDTFNQFRVAYGKKRVTWSSAMAAHSLDHAQRNGGGIRSDHLGGPYGETITPGYSIPPPGADMQGLTPFAAALVNWFCEFPDDPQLRKSGFTGVDVCPDIQQKIDGIKYDYVDPKMNHHDLLLGSEMTQIGCAYLRRQEPTDSAQFAGQYICNFN